MFFGWKEKLKKSQKSDHEAQQAKTTSKQTTSAGEIQNGINFFSLSFSDNNDDVDDVDSV